MGKKYAEFVKLFAKSVVHPSNKIFDEIGKLVNDEEIASALVYLSGFCATKTEPKDWKKLAKK